MSVSSINSRLCRLSALAGSLASVGTLLAFFGGWSWFTELASHFCVQYFAVLAVAVLVLGARRRRSALIFAAFALMNVAAVYPLYVEDPPEIDALVTPFRVMQSNVFADNRRYDLVLNAVAAYRPDVLVVEELNDAWQEHLAALSATYPYSVTEPRDDHFGIALYSRHPLRNARVISLGAVPSIVADVELEATPLRVLATHPMPPLVDFYARIRNTQLEEMAQFLKAGPRPAILVGDLNITPWSPYFTRLLEEADLRDSMRGHGPQFTWPVQVWPVRVPIDHCLYSSGVRVVDRRVGPYVGSDHYPLIIDLEVGEPADRVQITRKPD